MAAVRFSCFAAFQVVPILIQLALIWIGFQVVCNPDPVTFTAWHAYGDRMATLAGARPNLSLDIAFDVDCLCHAFEMIWAATGFVLAGLIDNVTLGYLALMSEHPGHAMSVESDRVDITVRRLDGSYSVTVLRA